MKRLLVVVVVAGLVLVTWLLASSRQLAQTPPQRAGGRPARSADPVAHARLEKLNTVVGVPASDSVNGRPIWALEPRI